MSNRAVDLVSTGDSTSDLGRSLRRLARMVLASAALVNGGCDAPTNDSSMKVELDLHTLSATARVLAFSHSNGATQITICPVHKCNPEMHVTLTIPDGGVKPPQMEQWRHVQEGDLIEIPGHSRQDGESIAHYGCAKFPAKAGIGI